MVGKIVNDITLWLAKRLERNMDFVSVIKTVAPWIGTALGGPLGGLAIEAATQALGVSEKTAEGLKNAIAGVSAEDMLALKKADQEFAVRMQELGFKNMADIAAIEAGDRASARDMQKTNRSRIPAILSIIVTVGFFGLLLGMMTKWLVVSDSQALLLLLGSLSTAWGMVMSFWFGTSNSSANKTELLAKVPAVK